MRVRALRVGHLLIPQKISLFHSPMLAKFEYWSCSTASHSVNKLSVGVTAETAVSTLPRQFFHAYFDCTAGINSLSPKFLNPPSPSLCLAAYTVKIDNSDRAWEAEAARAVSSRVADVTSTVTPRRERCQSATFYR